MITANGLLQTFDQHRCEMPVQVNNLPELLQLQVTEMWINNEGNCAKQLDAVFEILRTLQRQNDDISKIVSSIEISWLAMLVCLETNEERADIYVDNSISPNI
jgi:dihydroorotate dehydrogenase